MKHTHEKVCDHWEPKGRKGTSDLRAESAGGHDSGAAEGGVDADATKKHLYQQARKLGIDGRSIMSEDELVEALCTAKDRETRKSRENR
ncbi:MULTISPECIES: hypothetical protein [Rhodococcus]|uniref:hypothetical protein n=1 Tax=Rhodococcus TaxID=1827 RepID=UPI002E1F7D97